MTSSIAHFPLYLALVAASLMLAPASGQAEERNYRSRVRGVEPAEDPTQSYEFLVNKGKLFFQYGQFRESAQAFIAACATDQGAKEAGCWQRLATVAEKAGMVGLAIDAWANAAVLEPRLADQAKREGDRLSSSFGQVTVKPPPGRDLPTSPIELSYQGLLIDPQIKEYLKKFLDLAAVDGIGEAELWLPKGKYEASGISFEVTPGAPVEVALSPSLVPYRPVSFGLADRQPARPVPGPWEVGVSFELSFGNAPGDGIGVAPVGLGGNVSVGRRLGPVRLEGRMRWGGTATASAGDDIEAVRTGTAWHVLGQFDVGVDLSMASGLYLTPHAGFVAGSLGELLLSCLAEQKATGVVYAGECRLGAAAAGAQAGADIWWVPLKTGGRVLFRAGVWGEALGGGIRAIAGNDLGGGLDTRLIRVDSNQFTWIRAGLNVGTAIRF